MNRDKTADLTGVITYNTEMIELCNGTNEWTTDNRL